MNRKSILIAQLALAAMVLGSIGASANPTPNPPNAPTSTQGAAVQAAANNAPAVPLSPVGSSFTYQGVLNQGGVPANGQFDFTFKLFDALNAGTQVNSTLTVLNVTVRNGAFSVVLDFGADAFQGSARWLEMAVRPAGSGTYTTLSPRQPLTATPYAMSLMPGAVINGSTDNPILSANNEGDGDGLFGSSIDGSGVWGASDNGRGVEGSSVYGTGVVGNSDGGKGVAGSSTSNDGVIGISNTGYGVNGISSSSFGVAGTSTSGIAGWFDSTSGIGVHGRSTSRPGGWFTSISDSGVNGFSTSASGVRGQSDTFDGVSGISTSGIGVAGTSTSGRGVVGISQAAQEGVYGESRQSTSSFSTAGVHGVSFDCDPGLQIDPTKQDQPGGGYACVGVLGEGAHNGVFGLSTSGIGALGVSTNYHGVYGISTHDSGVYGISTNSYGVFGGSTNDSGVYGTTAAWGYAGAAGVHTGSNPGNGLYGRSDNGSGVYGETFVIGGTGVFGQNRSNGAGNGISGQAPTVSGSYAGNFIGNVRITGSCCGMSMGTIQIDHPVDPANKYLSQSLVQSPDMMSIHNGNVTTNANGEAVVTLPNYFEALNSDFRYQLTVMGQFAQAIVSSKIKDNHFTIKTDKPSVEVSWQVTGIRQDPYAEQNRVSVEQDKPAEEKGYYLHPEVYGQPDTKSVDPHVRNPQTGNDEKPNSNTSTYTQVPGSK